MPKAFHAGAAKNVSLPRENAINSYGMVTDLLGGGVTEMDMTDGTG
ncbi:MAG: hypothetical protein AB2L13_07150 [Spirochaetota bacterium]|jgi:hypothetical protein